MGEGAMRGAPGCHPGGAPGHPQSHPGTFQLSEKGTYGQRRNLLPPQNITLALCRRMHPHWDAQAQGEDTQRDVGFSVPPSKAASPWGTGPRQVIAPVPPCPQFCTHPCRLWCGPLPPCLLHTAAVELGARQTKAAASPHVLLCPTPFPFLHWKGILQAPPGLFLQQGGEEKGQRMMQQSPGLKGDYFLIDKRDARTPPCCRFGSCWDVPAGDPEAARVLGGHHPSPALSEVPGSKQSPPQHG